MGHEMDEDGNKHQDGSRILGIDESLKYLQRKVENIEKSKKLGAEVVHRRKGEILQTALENEAAFARIEKSHETLRKVGQAAAIGLVCLYAFKIADEGLGLIQWFLKRWKSKKKQAYETKAKEGSEDGKLSNSSARLDRRNYNLHPGRLHARHWEVCEPLES
jgi:hypothetical protein